MPQDPLPPPTSLFWTTLTPFLHLRRGQQTGWEWLACTVSAWPATRPPATPGTVGPAGCQDQQRIRTKWSTRVDQGLFNYRPQHVQMGTSTSSTNVLSPVLFMLFTHDYVTTHGSNTLISLPTTQPFLRLISNNDNKTIWREGPDAGGLGQWKPLQHQHQETQRNNRWFWKSKTTLHSGLSINGGQGRAGGAGHGPQVPRTAHLRRPGLDYEHH